MNKIFVTRKIPQAGLDLLKDYDLKVSPYDRVLTKEELLENVKDIDALLCLLTDKIDKEIMDAAGKQLKIIANYAVGFDNIDVKAASQRKIIVTNTPEVLTETVAEHTIALLFAISRRIVEADKFTRENKFKAWEPMLFLGSDISGKTLGIVGLGRIGVAVAKRMKDGFDLKILYYDVNRNEKLEKQYGLEYSSLEDLLKESDFVSLHVPLLPQTEHLINEKKLKLIKETAYLINTSRGPVIDEKALVKALKNKQIAGAALDVFENEPKLAPGLAELDNVVLTPHIASATIETRSKMAEMAAQNIIDALEGRRPKNLVNEIQKP